MGHSPFPSAAVCNAGVNAAFPTAQPCLTIVLAWRKACQSRPVCLFLPDKICCQIGHARMTLSDSRYHLGECNSFANHDLRKGIYPEHRWYGTCHCLVETTVSTPVSYQGWLAGSDGWRGGGERRVASGTVLPLPGPPPECCDPSSRKEKSHAGASIQPNLAL